MRVVVLLALGMVSGLSLGCSGGQADVPPPSQADAANQPPLPTATAIGGEGGAASSTNSNVTGS
jgi:hypothetical protein